MDGDELREALEPLTAAIRSISHGGVSGPEGLEMLAIAMVGDDVRAKSLRGSVAARLDDIAIALSFQTETLERIAESLEDLALKYAPDE